RQRPHKRVLKLFYLSGVGTRFKDADQSATRVPCAGRGERLGYRRRMMREVIDHGDVSNLAPYLEPALDALEVRQRLGNPRAIQSQTLAGRDHSQTILYVEQPCERSVISTKLPTA